MAAFIAETADTDAYTGPDTSTPWKRSKCGQFRYMHGYLLTVLRVSVRPSPSPRGARPVIRWDAAVDGLPAPARSDGLHVRMSDAKDACEDFVGRSCDRCRRSGFLRDLSGKAYTCETCGGAGVFRG